MFIVERIISLLTYATVLIIICFLLSRCQRKQVKTVLFIYLLLLMVFAFNYKPYYTADLFRLREYIQYWVSLTPERLIAYALDSNAPSWVVFSYLVSKMGNINWLQTISCLISFGISLYLIWSNIERNNIRGSDRALILFSYMAIGAIYLQAISDIRHIIGFTIVAYCLYREVELGKKFWIHVPLYLIAALFHPSVIVLVAARFLVVGFTEKGWQSKVFAIALIVLIILFSYRQGSQYIMSAFAKANSYLTGREYTYFWEILIGFLEATQTIYILQYFRKNFIADKKTNYLWFFTIAVQIGSIALLPFSYAVFRRYTLFCTMITISFLGKVLSTELAKRRRITIFKEWMYLLSILIFIISFARGDICGYKFFVLK